MTTCISVRIALVTACQGEAGRRANCLTLKAKISSRSAQVARKHPLFTPSRIAANLMPSCFLTLTNNVLLRHSNTTGKLLDQIFLGRVFRFQCLDVDVGENRIVIQSVPFNKFGTRNTNTIRAIILFSICPFQFMYNFELTHCCCRSGRKKCPCNERHAHADCWKLYASLQHGSSPLLWKQIVLMPLR